MVNLGIRLRLKPNKCQEKQLFANSNTYRFVYNWALGKQSSVNKFLSPEDLSLEMTKYKKTPEGLWLSNFSAYMIKQAIRDACNSCKKFLKGERRYPKFKSKRHTLPSFYQRCDGDGIIFSGDYVKIEKLGKIKVSRSQLESFEEKYGICFNKLRVLNPRVSFDGLHWYVSVSFEFDNTLMLNQNSDVSLGVDVGVKDLAIVSNGKVYPNINKSKKVRKLKKSLRHLKKSISRKYYKNRENKERKDIQKGDKFNKTKNIIKQEKRALKVQQRLNNVRINYLHNVSSEMVKTKPLRIVMEDLNIKGMMKNLHLSKAVQEQSLFEFKRMVEYKCKLYNVEFVEANRWYPSSKTCSCCGSIKHDLTLEDRVYVCSTCGLIIDRDLNASINLSRYVYKERIVS